MRKPNAVHEEGFACVRSHAERVADMKRTRTKLGQKPDGFRTLLIELPGTISPEQLTDELYDHYTALGLWSGSTSPQKIITHFERHHADGSDSPMRRLVGDMYRKANDAYANRFHGICCIGLTEWRRDPDDHPLRELFSYIKATDDEVQYVLCVNRSRGGCGELMHAAASFFDLDHIVLNDEAVDIRSILTATAERWRFRLEDDCLGRLCEVYELLADPEQYGTARAAELLSHRLEDVLLTLRSADQHHRRVRPEHLAALLPDSEWFACLTGSTSRTPIGFSAGGGDERECMQQ